MSPPFAKDKIEPGYASAQKALGPVRFHRHWVIGEARGLEEALDLAMTEVDSVDLEDRPPVARPSIGRFDLTPREVEVIALVASGMSDGEIAESFVISKKTASTHVANIKSKLGARTRVEIAVMARNAGLD